MTIYSSIPWLSVLVLASASMVTTGAATLASSACCDALSNELGSVVSFPGSAAYNASISSYWAQQEMLIRPSCVLSATSVNHVSEALHVLVPLSCQFAVRSGGHGAHAGIANIENGVTIDLAGLNFITPSAEGSLVAVGPGQTWGAVYTTLDPLGVSVPGGRDGPVGVGGSTTGGAFGYFAPKVGFGCDSVVEFEVVLANGSIVTATASTNSDLWLALKGGSSNFGIVTKFVFSTFQLGSDIWGGNAYYLVTALSTQLSAFYDFVADQHYDVDAGLILNLAFSSETGALLTNQYAYARPVVNPPAFQPFTSIPDQIQNVTALLSLGAFSIQEGMVSPRGVQQVTFSVTFKNALPVLQRVWDAFNASTEGISGVDGVQWAISLVPIVPAIAAQSKARGGNVLGLDHIPPQGLVMAVLTASFLSPDDYSLVSAAADKLLADIISASKDYNASHPYVDMNHPGSSQDPIAGYGKRNALFIERTARKYDPHGVFQTLMPGGFKVWN